MILILVDRIFENLFFRKLYHLFGGSLFVLGLVFLDKKWFIVLDAIYIVGFKVFGKRISFAAIGVLLLYLLSNSSFITLYATVIWLVGDGMAALIGAAYGKKKWSWSTHKTILGSVTFLFSSILVALPFVSTHIDAPLTILFILVVAPCLWATIIEALPLSFIKDRKADDNLLVILSTGLLLYGLHLVFGTIFRF
jgi:dolichol kinase